MKLKNLWILFFGLLNCVLIAQENQNYISGKINAPIIIDRIIEENHLLDDRRDSKQIYENVTEELYTSLKSIPIEFDGDYFKGRTSSNTYGLIETTRIEGWLDLERNISNVVVAFTRTKNGKSNICDYFLDYSYEINYKNLKVREQKPIGAIDKNITLFYFEPSAKTNLTINNYKYIEKTNCPKRNSSKEFVYKKINEDYLKEKLSSHWSYFRFTVNWNGTIVNPKQPLGIAFIKKPNAATIDLDIHPARTDKKYTWGEHDSEIYIDEIMTNLAYNDFPLPERILLGTILGELQLGSSELADPAASNKLGEITIAAFHIYPTFTRNKLQNTFTIRVVYTETGELVFANTIYFKDLIDTDMNRLFEPELSQAIKKFAEEKKLTVLE